MSKRYIEDVLPLGELNKTAQKGGGIGSLNAMHPYFARRPLTASRAMTLAALVDAPESDEDREVLEKLLLGLSADEWPDKPKLLEQARELIRKAHGGKAPRVLDPFAGGGSMPLEAMRLGCEATALDLNPVAYLALMASLVYPQKFKNGSANGHNHEAHVATDTPSKPHTQMSWTDNGKPGTPKLVEDVRYWAEWVMTQAEAALDGCYPTDDDGAIPVNYLWARTIVCPHCGGEIPLIRRRWLQKIKGKELIAYRLNVNSAEKTYEVEIIRGQEAEDDVPDTGTMRGATVECLYCGTPTERERIAEQGRQNQMGQHMLIVVLSRSDESGRDFREVKQSDLEAYNRATEAVNKAVEEGFDFWGFERLLEVLPDEPTPPEKARSVSIRLYGQTQWQHLYNDRQILSLLHLGRQIREARDFISQEQSDSEYAKGVSLLLDCILMKIVMYNSRIAFWQPHGLKTSAMARHDIPVTWDYAEINPFSGAAGSWQSAIRVYLYSLQNLVGSTLHEGHVQLGSATQMPTEWAGTFDAVVTDPPYYDSITYADLSDYFYPWHKRIIGDDYPEAFVTEVTPKDNELVQEAVYHGGTKAKAKKYYEDGMAQAFKEMNRVLKKNGVAVIMFAHKKSSAWETLVAALIRAGFQVTASWPLQTEGRRLQSYRAVALASSVYLVCRKRAHTAELTGYIEDIQEELSSTIRRYLEKFWSSGIGGADFFMSAIGPGLSVYSRFARVERYDGTQVTVSDFLDLVRHEVAVFAIERIVGERGFTERIDQATQFYLLWRWGYSNWDVPDGEAVLLSTAVGIDLSLLTNRFNLVKGVKGKLRLLGPNDRKDHLEKVVDRVRAGGAVPLIDVLHKAALLWAADRQDELSSLVAARGGEMWPVAQAVVELLPRDNPERKSLESMLGIRVDIESRAQKWAATNAPKPQPKQLGLWKDDEK